MNTTTIEMYSCEGYLNASRRHHAYVLPVKAIQAPTNVAHNQLGYTEARNHDLQQLLAEVMKAAQVKHLRYSLNGETKTVHAD